MPTNSRDRGSKQQGSEGPKGVRLQRVMAEAGIASRRDCEEMITRGIVEVNGKIVDHLPAFVDPMKDRIVVDGKPLKLARPVPSGKGVPGAPTGPGRVSGRVYVMLHKPDRVLCTTRDEISENAGQGFTAPGAGGRTTVTELVQHPTGARLYPAGRLDYHTTGLVLLTNDGVLADRLTHARYGVTRTYRVTVKGRVSQELLRDLRRRLGVERPRPEAAGTGVVGRVAGGRRVFGGSAGEMPDSVRLVREPGQMTTVGHEGVRTEVAATNSVIEITLREGKSRQLRAILEQMGALTRKLTRTAIGPLRLRGVAVGQWRDLTGEELDTLMRSASMASSGGGGGGGGSGRGASTRDRARTQPTGPKTRGIKRGGRPNSESRGGPRGGGRDDRSGRGGGKGGARGARGGGGGGGGRSRPERRS